LNTIRIVLILLGMLSVSLVLHLLIYGSDYSYSTLSDSLFVVGIITFLPALVMQMRAYQIFYGLQYGFKSLYSRDFYKHYPRYRDYREEKDTDVKTSLFIEVMIVSGAIIIAAIILAGMVTS